MENKKKLGRPFTYAKGKKNFSIRLTDIERNSIEAKFGSVQKMVEIELKKIKSPKN